MQPGEGLIPTDVTPEDAPRLRPEGTGSELDTIYGPIQGPIARLNEYLAEEFRLQIDSNRILTVL